MKLLSLRMPVLLGLLACAAVMAVPGTAWAAPEATAEGQAPREPHHRLDTSSPDRRSAGRIASAPGFSGRGIAD